MAEGGDKHPLADKLKSALDALSIGDTKSRPKSNYAFWSTQPVSQFGEAEEGSSSATGSGNGPIDAPKTVADVKKEPYALPANFQWDDCDVDSDQTLAELHELLSLHYVEDDENMFRFAYSADFLRWALRPPGTRREWLCGIRVTTTKKLVAFISGVPMRMRVDGEERPMVEINFLCVHKKLRHKRLAPVLIREITRRVNLTDIWQAVYTAGVVLPRPAAEAQYWHRTLNPRKLVEVGFSRLAPRMTMARAIKLYRVGATPTIPGLRPMVAADVPAVTRLLTGYLASFRLAPVLHEEEVAHWMLPVPNVMHTYVVERAGTGELTDLLSFYTLPSTVINHKTHTSLTAAYMFYSVPATVPLAQLLGDALILASSTGHDVFNALDIFENGPVLRDLKFGIGDGKLRYYLYNWRVAKGMQPSDVGLVML
ncbi:hypothetical protein QBZ16_000050 [Prototheca wickerhamii]|uniref:Glycylpeptide N-tetradecanoyltransferase n=1 Tax=Prototheca wickerhamii TaxID=3111 RepID=A0AAD9IP24_PROWI|nr:hypothetical protein QBZ16_000050 [Prototheca wickerhamii]